MIENRSNKVEPLEPIPPAPAAGGLTVKLRPDITPGMSVRHVGGTVHTVIEITPEGVRLSGVANLVHQHVLIPVC